MLAVVLFAVLVLLCLVGLVLWTRLAASNARTIEAPDGELERLFVGGVMCRYVVTSGTMVRLELFDWGLRLRGMLISRWVVPTWEARYDELAIAELVALPASRHAIWFRLRDSAGAIGFLSDRSPEIFRVLEKHGVPVNRSVTRVRRVAELYNEPS